MKEGGFKELWKDNKKYEHVPLPKSVLKILKRQHNGYVLHAFIYHDTKNWADGKDYKSMVLGFDKIIRVNIVYIERGPGVCCGMDPCVHDWDDLAREIAFDYPEYAKKNKKNKMTTDELLEKLPSHIDTEWLNLHNNGINWAASYGIEDEFLWMNPNAEELPYDNACAYGKTPNEALQGLYDWCVKHNML